MSIAKILWIDDEIDSLKSQVMFLESKGYEVATFTNGYDGIDYVKENIVDVVLLDERGKMLTSPGLSKLISERAVNGARRVHFIIGGAFGVTETVRKRADFVWQLSQLVFPHQLVRLILAEQIYRACSILKNEKYHHV